MNSPAVCGSTTDTDRSADPAPTIVGTANSPRR